MDKKGKLGKSGGTEKETEKKVSDGNRTRQEIKKPRSVNFAVNRGDTIRTCDLYVPNVAL